MDSRKKSKNGLRGYMSKKEKKHMGVRKIGADQYEIHFQVSGKRKQYRISASSASKAKKIRDEHLVEFRKELAISANPLQRLKADFGQVWNSLNADIEAEDRFIAKTRGRYRNTFWRMFGDFRGKCYPHVQSPADLTLSFFREYRNYYANDLGRPTGLRSELIHVKAIMRRLYYLGYCSKELLEDLKELKKPPAKKKAYPEITKTDINKLMLAMKDDRLDYYNIIYFLKRTGRRINESSLIEKKDVRVKGFMPVAMHIRAETTKKKVDAPLEYLDEALTKHVYKGMRNNKTKWLFPNRLSNRCHPNRVRDYLKKMSVEILGIKITPHYFRHRFCTECGKANVPIADVKAISGIRDTKVLLDYYSHSTSVGMKQVLEVTK